MRTALATRGSWTCVKPMPNRKRILAFSPVPLSISQSRRVLLQQTNAFSRGRHPIRPTRRQLPRLGPIRLNQHLVEAKCVGDLADRAN